MDPGGVVLDEQVRALGAVQAPGEPRSRWRPPSFGFEGVGQADGDVGIQRRGIAGVYYLPARPRSTPRDRQWYPVGDSPRQVSDVFRRTPVWRSWATQRAGLFERRRRLGARVAPSARQPDRSNI